MPVASRAAKGSSTQPLEGPAGHDDLRRQAATDAPHAPLLPAAAQYAAAPFGCATAGNPAVFGAPVGKIRGTGVCILLTIVTFGIYSLV